MSERCMEGDDCPYPGIYRCFDCKGYVCEHHGRVHFPMPALKHWEEEKQRYWEQGIAWIKEKAELKADLEILRNRIRELEHGTTV